MANVTDTHGGRVDRDAREASKAGVGYSDLSEAVDLGEHERLFASGDPVRAYAWRSIYFDPELASAWTSLGYLVPEEE